MTTEVLTNIDRYVHSVLEYRHVHMTCLYSKKEKKSASNNLTVLTVYLVAVSVRVIQIPLVNAREIQTWAQTW